MPRNLRRRRLYLEPLEARIALNSYFVAPNGNDHNPGTSSAPWLTLQHAADKVVAGDKVTVLAGTYAGFSLGWNFPQNGTASARITFQANPGVVITSRNPYTADGIDLEGSSYITITGFSVLNPAIGGTITRAGIRAVAYSGASNAQGVIIQNCQADDCGKWGIFTSHEDNILIANNVASHSQTQHGIYVSNACVNPVVRDNVVFGNHDCGIQLNGDLSQGGNGLIIGAKVEANIIHDNGVGGGAAINCDGLQASLIENNLLYNNHASGIALFKIDGAAGSINNLVANNTVLEASDGRWALLIANGSTGNIVFNNILYNYNPSRGSINITADSLPGFTSNYNVVVSRFTANGGTTNITLPQWQTLTGQDRHSIISTPAALFVSPTTNNYHLLSTSPAIGAGVSQLAGHLAPTVDLADNTRPQGNRWDIGAYEFIPATTPLTSALFGQTSSQARQGTAISSSTIWSRWDWSYADVDMESGKLNSEDKPSGR
jgi:hypothetical protein